jgi:hypothetical protein
MLRCRANSEPKNERILLQTPCFRPEQIPVIAPNPNSRNGCESRPAREASSLVFSGRASICKWSSALYCNHGHALMSLFPLAFISQRAALARRIDNR